MAIVCLFTKIGKISTICTFRAENNQNIFVAAPGCETGPFRGPASRRSGEAPGLPGNPGCRRRHAPITRRHRRPSRFKGPATAGRQPGRPSAPQRPPLIKNSDPAPRGSDRNYRSKERGYFTTSFNRMSLAARAASAGFFAVALFSCALAATRSPCLAAITARR